MAVCDNVPIITAINEFIEYSEYSKNWVESSASTLQTPGGINRTTLAGYIAQVDAAASAATTSINNDRQTISNLRDNAEDEFQDAISSLTVTTPFDFTTGGTVTARNQAILWPEVDGGTGSYYRWDGALPKEVPPNSTPHGTGGIEPGAWVDVGQAALRAKLASDDGGEAVTVRLGQNLKEYTDTNLIENTSGVNQGTYNITHNPQHNSISGDGYMNFILSGGSANQPNQIVGNVANSGFLQTILGGYDNYIENSLASTIHSMHSSIIDGSHSAIYGGSFSSISAGGYQFMGGGTQNVNNAGFSTTLTSRNSSVAEGGEFNAMLTSDNCTIGNAEYCTIFGSSDSSIADGAVYSAIENSRGTTIGSSNDAYARGPRITIGDGSTGAYAIGADSVIGDGCVDSVSFGRFNETTARNTWVSGLEATSYTQGMLARAAGKFSVGGDAQSSEIIIKRQTNNGAGSATTNNGSRFVVPEGKAILAELQVVGKSTTGDINAYTYKVVIYRSVGGSAILKSITEDILHEDDETAGVSVGPSSNAINVLCESPNSSVRWVITMRMTEVA